MTVVLDTSAVAAVVLREPDVEAFLAPMTRAAGGFVVGAATAVESGIIVEAKQGSDAAADLRTLLTRLAVQTVLVDEGHAVAGWRRFDKGRHPAGLNLGDCFAYGLAKVEGAPLLFKGNDFAQTDLACAL